MRTWLAGLILVVSASAAFADTLNRGNGAEPDSLDPQFVGTLPEENILDDLMVGLTTLDAAAKPIPGIAQSWTVSPDGLTWRFHLRPATWSDGKPVTAGDFVFAWRRLFDPKTASRYAANLWVLKNAQAISSGKMPPEALVVTAPKADTLIVTLEHPAPYLPELLAHPSASPLPQVARNAGWARPGNYVNDGPYLLKDWIPGDHITLMRNPRFYDVAKVAIETVVYFPTSDQDAALTRFRSHALDMQSPAPANQMGWIRTNLPGTLHATPALGLDYIAINLSDPDLKDVRVRRAINLAYNREAITEKVLKKGEPPAYSYVPPGTANYTGGPVMDFRTMPFPARVAQAQKLMQDAGYGPFQRLHLNFETTGNSDYRKLAVVLQAMLKIIYIDVTIQTADLPIHLRNLRLHQYQLGSANWFADYDDASNFLDLLRSDAGNNYAGYRNPRFDAALRAAENESDPAKRIHALMAAEAMALQDYPWVPLRYPVQTDLVAAKIQGWTDNAADMHLSRWLRLRK